MTKILSCDVDFSPHTTVDDYVKDLVDLSRDILDWRAVGTKLKISEEDLDKIEEASASNIEGPLQAMYEKWIDNNFAVPLTVLANELISVLEDEGFNNVADIIRKKYCKKDLVMVYLPWIC